MFSIDVKLLVLGASLGFASLYLKSPVDQLSPGGNASNAWAGAYHRVQHALGPFTDGSGSIDQFPPAETWRPPLHTDSKEKVVVEKREDIMAPRTPVYFISHGSPFTMFQPEGRPYRCWQSIGGELRDEVKPTAIVVVSAHWQAEGDVVGVTSVEKNELLYDYYGFPSHFYEVRFQSRGSPELASRVMDLLDAEGIKSRPVNRGLDHGVFVPFIGIFKDAKTDVPVIQVSLQGSDDPSQAIALGRALQPLRDEGVVLMGAGMAVHNLKDFRLSGDAETAYTAPFLDYLATMIGDHTGTDRERLAEKVFERSVTRKAHPTAEHLLPLHFAIGAAGDDEGEVLLQLSEGPLGWGSYVFRPSHDQVL